MRNLRVLAVIVLVMVVLATVAYAHDWYPRECCSDQDCGPAVVLSKTNKGITLQDKFGSGHFIPWGDPMIKSSPDGKYHICINSDVNGGEMQGSVLCVFFPDQGS